MERSLALAGAAVALVVAAFLAYAECQDALGAMSLLQVLAAACVGAAMWLAGSAFFGRERAAHAVPLAYLLGGLALFVAVLALPEEATPARLRAVFASVAGWAGIVFLWPFFCLAWLLSSAGLGHCLA